MGGQRKGGGVSRRNGAGGSEGTKSFFCQVGLEIRSVCGMGKARVG